PGQIADCQNAQSLAFQLVDLFHVFTPKQVSALLCLPESGLTPPVEGAGDFSTGTLGIIAPALTVAGNVGSHTIKIIQVSTGQDVPGASVTVSASAGTASTFQYGTLLTPVTLLANTSYYIVSQEFAGGDQWHDADGTVITTSVASVDQGVYS